MRKHGWQLPYHPLQVVAIAVFMALGFAFYVFFLPFVGRKLFQYVVVGLYTPLVACVFFLYIWCAATDPGDPSVFKSKKYRRIKDNKKEAHTKGSKQGDSEAHHATVGDNPHDEGISTVTIGGNVANKLDRERTPCCSTSFLAVLLGLSPLSLLCSCCSSQKQSSEKQINEDGMFYCSLCEVEVLKYSKHCRVCDKCVDSFDHHCRWINNCIGRKNYRGFFILMVSALLLLILQWSIGVLVLTLCFLERKRFSVEIISKLGSSFSLAPFVIVVASCTFLAIVATLPLAQLFFFHILLIKKGISTYDYIVALRDQDQPTVGQQSPQMSSVSSFTGLSSTSSFNTFHRGGWCTPPRLFLEDQFDVVPPETSMPLNSAGKRMMPDESTRKRNAGTVKISPWTLARLNAEKVSKAAAQARKKSRILKPVVSREKPLGKERDDIFGHGSNQIVMKPDNRQRTNKRGRLPMDLPLEPLANISASATDSNASDLAPETSTSLTPLQLEARNAFRAGRVIPPTALVASPDSSVDSPDLYPFRVSSSGVEESQGLTSAPYAGTASEKGLQLSRSTSDGYDASGGEDSDRVPSRIVHRSSNWASLVANSGHGDMSDKLKEPCPARFKDETRLL